MTTTTAPLRVSSPPSSPIPQVRTTTAVFALIGALGCALYISSLFIFPNGFGEVRNLFNHPLTLTAFWTGFIGLAGIGALFVPLIGNRLPFWLALLTAFHFVLMAGQAFATATVLPEMTTLIHGRVTEAEFQSWVDTPLMLVHGLSHGLTGLIAFIAIAIIGRKRRLFGWGVTTLCILAALASPLWHVPPGGLMGALAVLGMILALRKEEAVAT